MTEDFLHYIWQYQLYIEDNGTAAGGEKIIPLHTGIKNEDGGPDFLDVRVKIDDTLWAGCVEIHVRSSDWERHGHHMDPAYNNVVLHVVYQNDADTFNARGQKIPVMELHFDSRYFDNYNKLIHNNPSSIACRDEFSRIDPFTVSSWLERLAVERLEQKSAVIMQAYALTGNHWEETFYRQLARNFGFNLNAMPFEMLAKSLPLNILLKHKSDLHQIEALLFGQAGMLTGDNDGDDYYTGLRKEYLFLQKKYSLTPIDGFLWKFLRLRPVNFPTIRLAQFASLIYRNEHLFSQVIDAVGANVFEKIFEVAASDYWNTHYTFGKDSPKRVKSFGKTSLQTVLINTVGPFLFTYGKARGKEEYCTRAVNLLVSLPPEKNSILTGWEKLGVSNPDAFVSQALLQLKNSYCSPKRCLHCAIGNKVIKS